MTDTREKIEIIKASLIEHFDDLMDAVSEDLLIADGNGVVLRVSPSFEKVYGLQKENAIGETVFALEKEGYFKPSIIAEVLKRNEKVTKDQTTKDNRTIVVTATPVRDSRGEIQFVVSYSRDITEVIELQKKYATMKDQIERYSSEISKLRSQANNVDIIRNSRAMEQVMITVGQVAEYDVNVLLLGDSGVGKTSLARRIHQLSRRSDNSFIDINCAAIPENLLEAELFGYEKGAFTGADKKGKTGLFEMADQGTLFLDEVSEIPLPLQAKILKAIQEKTIMRVGGTVPVKVDFRLIAASNQELESCVARGTFRKDLFYRLNVMQIKVPSISERKDDVAPLIEHFLEQCNKKYGKKKSFSGDAIKYMVSYTWPGNVREISNVVERTFITSGGDVIQVSDLPEEILGGKEPFLDSIPQEGTLSDMILKLEEKMITEAYSKYGSTIEVAKHLGISQPTASRKIAKYINTKNPE